VVKGGTLTVEKLTITFNSLAQIANYFKSLENAPDITFSQRRRLMRLNEELDKEKKTLDAQIKILADKYCEYDSDGKPIVLENGGQKIKEELISDCEQELTEIYFSEIQIDWQPFKLEEKYLDQLKCDSITTKFIEQTFLQE
jgi:hypothetical protein